MPQYQFPGFKFNKRNADSTVLILSGKSFSKACAGAASASRASHRAAVASD